jgi:hypothetical protein
MADKPKRNDPCHCGSGSKYKNCHMEKDKSQFSSKLGMIGVALAVILGLFIAFSALSGGENQQNCPPGTSWSDAHQHCH